MGADLKALTGVFVVSGVIHLLKPEVYEAIMPKVVPAHRQVILASGVAELVCAAGLVDRRTRSVAGWVSFLLLLGVYPANIKMALDANRGSSTTAKAIAFGRLPFQVPMLRTAYRAASRR